MTKEKVLVVGGGFGGVKAALGLTDDPRFEVTLLSDSIDLRYYPTLFRVATGGKRANSSIPLSRIFENKSIKLVLGTAKSLDRQAHTITTNDGQVLSFHTLILGLGVVTNYFGIIGLPELSYSIKTQDEAERFKEHLHDQLSSDRHPDLNYVIIGAGPTGIELAGALPSYLKKIFEAHNLPVKKIHIDLIEAQKRLLPHLPRATSRRVAKQLRKLGVKLRLGASVSAETADELIVNGKPIRSHTVVWTAGVMNHPFFIDNKFAIMGHGKVGVDTYLQADENIFVIGDNANTPYSGLAQTALYDGAFVAHNLKRRASGKVFKCYVANAVITVIPAGPRWAAVIWGKLKLYGWVGYLMREAADFIGFHDLEPLNLATNQWLTEFTDQDNCEVCAIADASR